MGANAIQEALFPPELDSVEKLLLSFDIVYSLNHLGDVGHYHSRQLTDGAIEVRCETPYPHTFEQGVIEGVARNASLAKGRRYVDGPIGGDVSCICTVRAR